MLDLPIEVWFVFIHIDVVEWVLSEPGVDSESILVRPFGYWWQRYGLGRKITLDDLLPLVIYLILILIGINSGLDVQRILSCPIRTATLPSNGM